MKALGVYRIFGDDDVSLYVGMSTNPTARLNDHTHKDWWPDVRRIELTLHSSPREVVQTELDEIDRLRPIHNVQHCPWRKRAQSLLSGMNAERGASR